MHTGAWGRAHGAGREGLSIGDRQLKNKCHESGSSHSIKEKARSKQQAPVSDYQSPIINKQLKFTRP